MGLSFIKVLIGAVAVVVLMIDKCGADEYITHLGNGFQFHSWDFVRGHVIGWCSVGRK
jgi:hypothetical protein